MKVHIAFASQPVSPPGSRIINVVSFAFDPFLLDQFHWELKQCSGMLTSTPITFLLMAFTIGVALSYPNGRFRKISGQILMTTYTYHIIHIHNPNHLSVCLCVCYQKTPCYGVSLLPVCIMVSPCYGYGHLYGSHDLSS